MGFAESPNKLAPIKFFLFNDSYVLDTRLFQSIPQTLLLIKDPPQVISVL